MLEISKKTNLLEQSIYKYSLQDVEEPNLYREMFNYEEVPKLAFNQRRVPMNMPEDVWITDTSFRDGQQSMAPYTVKQIVDLYKLLAKLGGSYGLIRQSEFFIYTKKDRDAIDQCMSLGYTFRRSRPGSARRRRTFRWSRSSASRRPAFWFPAAITIFSKK